jgi:hypothetical protein
MPATNDEIGESRLVSNAILFRLTAFISLLAATTALLIFAGKIYGDQLALAGHTTERHTIHIAIGPDVLAIPANMIRFENQRRDGVARNINLYLSWPAMDGYTAEHATRFSDPGGSRDLIFLEFTQSVMSRDMSGRLDPIYRKLIEGKPMPGPSGLEMHHFNPRSGFGAEMLVTGKTRKGQDYVARCIFPTVPSDATSADCQRDIHVGRDLTLLYRFSSRNLTDWEAIDDAIHGFAAAHIHNGTQ